MQDYLFMKILVVGDSGVGKTSIVSRYFSGYFENNTIPTIGYDFTTKLYAKSSEKLCRLQVWDVAGQERYQAVSKLYARNVAGCLVVCDVTNPKTLENTLKWKKIIEEFSEAKIPIPYVLMQNKIDMIIESENEFTKEEYLKEFAEINGFVGFFQTSAKNNINLEESFDFLVEKAREVVLKTQDSTDEMKDREVMMRISNKYSKEAMGTNNNYELKRKKGWCC